VFIDAPSAGTVGEIFEDEFNRLSEGVVAVVDGDQDATFSKSDDVVFFIASYIGDESDVFIDAPASCVVTEVLDCVKGLNAEAVTKYDNSVQAKSNNIREAWASGGY